MPHSRSKRRKNDELTFSLQKAAKVFPILSTACRSRTAAWCILSYCVDKEIRLKNQTEFLQSMRPTEPLPGAEIQITNFNQLEEACDDHSLLWHVRFDQLDSQSNGVDRKLEVKTLSKYLETTKSLQILDVSNKCIKFNLQEVQILSEGLRYNKSLKKLNLRYSDLGPIGVGHISEALKENKTLHDLYVVGNNIQSEGAVALAECLKVNNHLQKLNVSANQIACEGMVALAQGLAKNSSIIQFTVARNRIEAQGAAAIANLLKENRTLRNIKFAINPIGCKSMAPISMALQSPDSVLQNLNLEETLLKAEGATQLARCLQTNKSLLVLKLSDNKILDEGAEAFGQLLAVNRRLRELHMINCGIDNVGGEALVDGLLQNETLETIQLAKNDFNGAGFIKERFKACIRGQLPNNEARNIFLTRKKRLKEEDDEAIELPNSPIPITRLGTIQSQDDGLGGPQSAVSNCMQS